MVKKMWLILLCFCSMQLSAESWGSIGNSVGSLGKKIGHTVVAVGKGLAQMVGYVPDGYIFSMIVYNGVQSNVEVQTRNYKEVMGGRFKGGIGSSMTMVPGGTTGKKFHKTKLYFALEVPSCNYTEDHYTLGQKKDKTVYVYHTFNDPNSGAATAERIGAVTGTSKKFSGLIYNGVGKNAPIEFVWNKKNIIVPVEPNTFSALTSTKKNHLRPSVLGLNGAAVAIGAVGLGVAMTSGSGKNVKKTSKPTRYNYQMTSSGGYETGLFPGNYMQPGVKVTKNGITKIEARLRDITPFECQIWNQIEPSPEGAVWNLMPFSMPNEPLWFIYTGQAIADTGALVDIPVGIVPEGKCVALMLLRPPVAQQLAKLYVVRINTNDETIAKNFLTRLAHTELPQYNIPSPSKQFVEQAQKTILTEKLSNNVGYLEDGTGLKGVIVGQDIFASYGAASTGPFFYTVTSPQYAIAAVEAIFMQFIDDLTKGAQTELNQYIQRWIKAYPTNPEGVRRALEIFLIKNGTKTLIIKDGEQERLSKSGYAMLNTVLYGPTSISRMAVWYPIAQKTSITPPTPWASVKDIILV
jgi:hypothetical protein